MSYRCCLDIDAIRAKITVFLRRLWSGYWGYEGQDTIVTRITSNTNLETPIYTLLIPQKKPLPYQAFRPLTDVG